jgi:hypothetical protein
VEHTQTASHGEPRNKGKIMGQKPPLKLRDSWALGPRLGWRTAFGNARTLQSLIDRQRALGQKQPATTDRVWVVGLAHSSENSA